MRIGFVVPGGLDRVSGGFIYDRHLIRALRAQGATVDVLPLAWLSLLPALASNALPLPAAPGAHDVLIEDELCHPAVLWRHRRSRRQGVRVVALVHNLASRQPATQQRRLRAAVERAYLRSVDGVAAVCASTLCDVESLTGRSLPIIVAPAGRDHVAALDGDFVAARALAPGPLRLMFAATVAPAKGLHRLIEVLQALIQAGQDVTVEVAGALDQDVPYVCALRARLLDARLDGRVRWHGLLRGDALWAVYRRCHALALPSDREAYPLVAIEALGSGLPVLATDQGGTAELLGVGLHGRCLPPDDRAAWTAALAGWARDRNSLAAAGRGALSRFQSLGTWGDAASGVLALCRRLRDGQ
ncbi:MAG TPA: glycosyltransferase family 4 protein [Polyangia bacterium]|nr:glycosyltransferase family 4 protein [Polyangia bacterium]